MPSLRDTTHAAALAALTGLSSFESELSRGDQRRLIRAGTEWYFTQGPSIVGRHGSCAVVTAGPPGAGKSSILDAAVPDLGERRIIDAHKAKEYLATWCVDHGMYADLLDQVLPDGRSLQPLGLAPLFQTLSTEIANAVRRESLALGEDVVVEATLASPLHGDRLLRSLAKADYADILIVSVETDLASAKNRAVDRWWQGRETDPLGGRLVRPEVIDRAYPAGARTSACRANAIRLLKTVREGQTALERASLIAYDDETMVAVDADPPRAI